MASKTHGGVGGSPAVEDEFACSGMQRGSLISIHDAVERIFNVVFRIEDDDHPHVNNDQMWLKLRGSVENVKAAKLFVMGVVNPEVQQEASHPLALKCVFCGAKGLFMDGLIRSTSAHIQILSPSLLRLTGLAEPVVRAYSLITDMIERYDSSVSKHTKEESTYVMEALESRRAFKSLVEKWEDRHTLDLLVLPGSVKEVLFNLVRESGRLNPPDELGGEGHEGSDFSSHPPHGTHISGTVSTNFAYVRGNGGMEGQQKSHSNMWRESQLSEEEGSLESEESLVSKEPQQSPGNHEFLLKFFTAMGYTEDAVNRVLSQTGPQEASQMLDLVQHEQDIINMCGHQNQPCETEHREEEAAVKLESIRPPGAGHGVDNDFVLGVMKKAALSCGYKEQKVSKVYSRVPLESSHQLLLELQKEGNTEQDVVSVTEKNRLRPKEDLYKKDPDMEVPNLIESNMSEWSLTPMTQQLSTLSKPPGTVASPAASIRLPQTSLHPNKTHSLVGNPLQEFRHSVTPTHSGHSTSPGRSRQRGPKSSVEVTGEQRFLEGLQMPFQLHLMDTPGNPQLRMIIIDGSNVAMSHGLGHFFSCRGIALAVQHFWDRGHREISALLPQWRLKSDARIKEKNYLTELQKLGLVSFTPSREVQGLRINSYDDRLMLQLAEKKNGVIVTNDNLRDLLFESPAWGDIIKKRLLQYTFVGDLFMVPDDPLGRYGPHLDDFLLADARPANVKNHSSLSVARVHPSTQPFRPQTEVRNPPDRTHSGPSDSAFGPQQGKPEQRTASETSSLKAQLCQVFPGLDNMVTLVLQSHPAVKDINFLSELLLQEQE